MTKITDSQKVQGLIIALINLAKEAGYNLDGAYISLENTEDPSSTTPAVMFNQLVNESLEFLDSIDQKEDKLNPANNTAKTKESKEDEPETKPRYI